MIVHLTEYGVEILRSNLNYRFARWCNKQDESVDIDFSKLTLTSTSMLVLDRDEMPVVLFESEWAISWALEHNEGLRLDDIHDR